MERPLLGAQCGRLQMFVYVPLHSIHGRPPQAAILASGRRIISKCVGPVFGVGTLTALGSRVLSAEPALIGPSLAAKAGLLDPVVQEPSSFH
jgi:hypothetical protein